MFGGIGCVRVPRCAQLPQISQRQQREDPEKDPGNFQPQHAGKPHKWTPDRLAKAPAATSQSPLHFARLGHRLGCHIRCFLRRRSSRCPRNWSRRGEARVPPLARRILCRRRVHRSHQRLHRVARSYSQRSAQANPIHRSKCRAVSPANNRFVTICNPPQLSVRCNVSSISDRFRHCEHLFTQPIPIKSALVRKRRIPIR